MKKRATPPQRLTTYRDKRDLAKSREPSGRPTPRRRSQRKPLRFCVQKHLASQLHYDFRLEHDGVLLSWAVPKGPSLNPKDRRLAVRVEDHPVEYADFEGVISEGYGAGIVMVWDRGTWQSQMPDIASALDQGELKFSLDGVKLKGSWVLVRTGRDPRHWLLIKHQDDWSGPIDVTKAAPQSVKSFGDLADILAAENPDQWQSQLAGHGGASGKLLRQIIDEAAARIVAREKTGKPKSRRTKH